MEISIIITNYRVIFEPLITGNLGKGFKKLFDIQNKYVKDYFQVPLGQIKRCEKQLNPLID